MEDFTSHPATKVTKSLRLVRLEIGLASGLSIKYRFAISMDFPDISRFLHCSSLNNAAKLTV